MLLLHDATHKGISAAVACVSVPVSVCRKQVRSVVAA